MLLTQPDGLEAPGLVSAAPPPPPEDPAPPIGRPLAQGIYDREKALLPRFRVPPPQQRAPALTLGFWQEPQGLRKNEWQAVL